MKTAWILAIVATLVALAAATFVWSGAYDIGADTAHWQSTSGLLAMLRERSIQSRIEGVRGPDLSDAALIRGGAGNYDAMCASCHLKPGLASSELSSALYPRPPDLTRARQSTPARDFWIIKHGIKMTGMPAWGAHMSDAYVWGMVAFLQQLPSLSPEPYAMMVESSGGHTHDESTAPTAHDAHPGHSESPAAHMHEGPASAHRRPPPDAGAASPSGHGASSRGTPTTAMHPDGHHDHAH